MFIALSSPPPQSLSLVKFKSLLPDYYRSALNLVYDHDNLRTWKSICLKCNKARRLASPISCCFLASLEFGFRRTATSR